MACCAFLVLGLIQACGGEEMSRDEALSRFGARLLVGFGLEGPPVTAPQGPNLDVARDRARYVLQRAPGTSRSTGVNHGSGPNQDTYEVILFPSSESSCARSDSAPGETTENPFTYCFQPSMNYWDTQVTSAQFWFYAGEGSTANASTLPLLMLTPAGQLLQAAEAPSKTSSDGWSTYTLGRRPLTSVTLGPFELQVHCPACRCHANESDKTPFLHILAQTGAPIRSPRHAPLNVPWSPSAVDLLQRPSRQRPGRGDCHRTGVDISFQELGWDNWIVHPASVTFYYCHGNCSAPGRATRALGITQCCAPSPGSMRSLRITTTSDGGHSFKYETLPNIIPEECTCI